jgi:hypothetical protein
MTLKLVKDQLHIDWEIMSRFLINILVRPVWIFFHNVQWVNSHYLHSEVMRHGGQLPILFTWPLVSQPSCYSLKWKEPSKGPGGHLAQQYCWIKYSTFRCLQWLFWATLRCAKCVAVSEGIENNLLLISHASLLTDRVPELSCFSTWQYKTDAT